MNTLRIEDASKKSTWNRKRVEHTILSFAIRQMFVRPCDKKLVVGIAIGRPVVEANPDRVPKLS